MPTSGPQPHTAARQFARVGASRGLSHECGVFVRPASAAAAVAAPSCRPNIARQRANGPEAPVHPLYNPLVPREPNQPNLTRAAVPADDGAEALQPIDVEQTDAAAEEADVRHFAWRVSKNLTRRIDQYLVDRVGYLSRNGVQKLIGEGFVRVNGKTTKASYKARIGDQVTMV